MAVTAHWIEATLIPAAALSQPQYILRLCAKLIDFHKVPGQHSGPHLARTFWKWWTIMALIQRQVFCASSATQPTL